MIPRSAITGAVGHWLVDLEVMGTVWRFSDEAIAVTDVGGTTRQYEAGLSTPTIEHTLEAGSPQTAALTIGARVDWAELVARGLDLQSASGILRHWYEGQILEAGSIVIRGDVVRPEWGSIDEPLVLTLERLPWVDPLLFPTALAVADEVTFPTRGAAYQIDDAVYGQTYPIVIGRPGFIGFLSSTSVVPIQPGSPGLMVEYSESAANWAGSRLLLAGHEVQAASVRIYDLSDGTNATRTPAHMNDNLGRKIAYVDFTGITASSNALRPALGHEYWVAWGETGGGMFNRERTGLMRGLGEVLRFLLEQSGLDVDIGQMEAQRSFLDAFKIDGFINSPVEVVKWIEQALVPFFPIRLVQGEAGVYYAGINWAPTSDDVVMNLDADSGELIRVSNVAPSAREDVRNHFTMEYGLTRGEVFLKRRVLTGTIAVETDGTASDSRERESLACKISQDRYKVRSHSKGCTMMVEDATADLALRHWALQKAMPRRATVYDGPPELEVLKPGQAITITDTDVHFASEIALVEAVELLPSGAVRLPIRLVDDHVRRARRTT